MDFIKNRNFWSMKKQTAKGIWCAQIYSVSWFVGFFLCHAHTHTKNESLPSTPDPESWFFAEYDRQDHSSLQHWEQTLEPSSVHLGAVYPGTSESPSPSEKVLLVYNSAACPVCSHTVVCPVASHGANRQGQRRNMLVFYNSVTFPQRSPFRNVPHSNLLEIIFSCLSHCLTSQLFACRYTYLVK